MIAYPTSSPLLCRKNAVVLQQFTLITLAHWYVKVNHHFGNEKLVKSYQWALRADSCALTNPFLSDIWRPKITNMQWWLEYKKHFFAGYCRKKWETLKQYHWIRILKLYSRALGCFPPKNPRKTANTKLTFEEWRQ